MDLHLRSIANKHQFTSKEGLAKTLDLPDRICRPVKTFVFLHGESVKSFLIAALEDKWFAETGPAWYTHDEQPITHASVQATDRSERTG